ncbi:MAG TPA: SIS domain-containing protein [Acidimicrobiales bacterium]|nr:SIS domain-containing protein [Acidimicrobiales bacterium]
MCGIIAIVRQRSDRAVPATASLISDLDAADAVIAGIEPGAHEPEVFLDPLDRVATALEHLDGELRGGTGVRALLVDPALAVTITERTASVLAWVDALDASLDDSEGVGDASLVEQVNAALIRVRDALWAVRSDRLRAAAGVADLAGPNPDRAAVDGFLSLYQALAGIDRLEVRGRDSAGVSVFVRNHTLDADDIDALSAGRIHDPLFTARAIRRCGDDVLCFVYKAAAEIGELGDNTAAIRDQIRDDELLHAALRADAEAVVLGHTRWASVGVISEANAHPLSSDERGHTDGPFVAAALNGDIDNFADLKAEYDLAIAPEITTDAKVIPTLLSRALDGGTGRIDAFRSTVASFDGSVAIGAVDGATPDRLLLALRGSGQALYVGFASDAYVVASEPYGLVEEAGTFLRLDGETPSDPTQPTSSRGQIVELSAAGAGTLAGLARWSYAGSELPVDGSEVRTAEITTRDIDRGDAPHYLLKEITESPNSFRKTLRGKLVHEGDRWRVSLGDATLPPDLRTSLRDGSIRRVITIGQGTAAVASHSFARALAEALDGVEVSVEASLATELSGFGMRPEMSDTLVVAISQSGTTTDTNRTVDLVRSRGAAVVSIVNRRGSDLCDKSDGVLYTSDGRDVEMSVASTKAFYAQIAAGFLLAYALAEELLQRPDARGLEAAGEAGRAMRSDVLAALRDLPEMMTRTVATRQAIASAAQRFAPPRRYWAIVGSGADRIAAQEIRVKLSELCYKSIACDAIEDKKHIDLSSEPLILVCATGLFGSNADDVAKEVAIYRAHKAAPVVIASEGEERFAAALEVLTVPVTHPKLAFVLGTVVGHLFGYEAALAIDAQAAPLREARTALDELVAATTDGDELLSRMADRLEPVARAWGDGLRSGAYDGHLEASAGSRISTLLRYASGVLPLDVFQLDFGRQGTPDVLAEALGAALGQGIEQLTRPVDAIKHQAKTVTVGISRSDEGVLGVPLVAAVVEAGAPRDRLSYRALRTLAALDQAVVEVTGYTRYAISGRVDSGDATIVVVDRGGISLDLPLRTEADPRLRGTKHRVAFEREVTVAVGRSDGRSVILVPEVKGNMCTGITLVHVRFHDRLAPAAMRSVLEGYRHRYAALRDAVCETEPTMRDDLLGTFSVVGLLTDPVLVMAAKWKPTD